MDIEIIEIAVNPDHVPIFFKYPPKYSISYIAKRIGSTIRSLRKEFPHLREWCGEHFSQKAIGIQNNLNKTKFTAHIIDMPYRDVQTQGKLQFRFSYQSNKKEQMNQHELSVYLLTRFGVVCPIQDFY